MAVLINNNAVSRLASSLSAVATTVSVTPGEGSRFPSPAAGNWFPVTIVKASGAVEIVRCTGRAGDVLNIVRSQEGTPATAFDAGDRIELRITKAAFEELMQQSSFSEFIKTLIDDADAAAARGTLGLTLQTSREDATSGRVMTVGAFGIGDQLTSTQTNLNNYNRPGKYVTPASGLTNLPSGWAQGRHVLDVSGGTGFMLQVLADAGAAGNKLAYRTAIGATFKSWVDIAEIKATAEIKGNYRGGIVLSANKTFVASDAGSYNFVSVTGLTFTLPSPAGITIGHRFVFAVSSTISACTVSLAAGTIGDINGGAGGSSVSLEPGATYEFVAITATAYHMIKTSTSGKRECTAWVNFNGAGTVAIRDSYNVSSITDIGVGTYGINFATPMANANYSPVVCTGVNNGSTIQGVAIGASAIGTNNDPTVNGFTIFCSAGGTTPFDISRVTVNVFGGKQ